MLLCLGKKDFPVDTNVGRIAARLGWIPLDAEQALEVVPLAALPLYPCIPAQDATERGRDCQMMVAEAC